MISNRCKAAGGRRNPTEWLTLSLMVGCQVVWLLAGLVYHIWPAAAIVAIPVIVAFASSLQHEALHGHPTRNARINEALVFLPLGLFYPFRRYRTLHLRHHADERLTDPYDDPESYYRALADWERLPGWMRSLLRGNNTLAGRVLMGPAIGIVGFYLAEARLLVEGARSIRLAWLFHAAGLVPVLLVAHHLFGMPVWLYALLAYASLSILAVRSFCEHQWAEHSDGRTVIVEKTVLGLLFLNNNLHLVHHKRPTVPWYRLPATYREERDEWLRLNGGYVFESYWQVAKAFAVRAKEPVVHPKSGSDVVTEVASFREVPDLAQA